MPKEHVLISTQIRCETGPTVVGDSDSDPTLMAQLGAQKVYRIGNTFAEYMTEWPPRRVLDRLSLLGFRLISMTGAGQTVIWTMARERADGGGGAVKNGQNGREQQQQQDMDDVD